MGWKMPQRPTWPQRGGRDPGLHWLDVVILIASVAITAGILWRLMD